MLFFVRTQDPRPSFHLDMGAEKCAAMTAHVACWSDAAARGIAVGGATAGAPHE